MREPWSNPPLPHPPGTSPYGDVITCWVTALNSRGEAAAVNLAVEPGARVERLGLGALRDDVVEIIEGVDNICRWMALSPPGTVFRAGEAEQPTDAGLVTVRYAIEVAGFSNGGVWTFKIGSGGRIKWLSHRPDSLDDDSVGEVRDPSEKWRTYVRDIPVHAHHHDHDHGDGHEH